MCIFITQYLLLNTNVLSRVLNLEYALLKSHDEVSEKQK